MNKLKISECFYSVQCEGVTTGVPAYFVRLTNCNLSCGMSTKMLNTGRKTGFEKQGCFQGDLHKEGKATWTCDTIPVWVKGTDYSYDDLLNKMTTDGQLENIFTGRTHIIWTGGEPTLPQHVAAIKGFLNHTRNHASTSIYKTQIFSEIETNGTLVTEDNFLNIWIEQINCSAKLSNSGMLKERRINPKAIEQIMDHSNYWFKFVVSTEDDIREFQNDYLKPFKIPDNRIVIMPGVDCLKDISERTRWLYEMTKKYGYRGITRGHILAWDATTGV